MMLMTDAPIELYDEVAIGPASTGDGEMLAYLDEVPAGAWLAVVLESVDRSTLTALDLLAYQRARAPAGGGASGCARSPRSARSLRSLGSLVLPPRTARSRHRRISRVPLTASPRARRPRRRRGSRSDSL